MEIALQGGFQVTGGGERCGFQHLGDATIAALDHAVGLWVFGFDQPVVDAVLGAGLIEGVLAGGLALAGGAKAVGERLAAISEDGAEAKRGLGPEALQEAGGGGGGFVRLDLERHPAAGPVDGREQAAALGLVRHLRQILHIHGHEARLVILKGLGQRRFPLRLGQQVG